MQYTFLTNPDQGAPLQLGTDRLPPAPDRCWKFIFLDDDVAVAQERVGIFRSAHFYRGAFEVLDKCDEFIAWNAPGVGVIVTKAVRGSTEAESAVAELPAFEVGFDDLPYAHCS